MFVSFFTSRIVLQNLGITDFGIYNIVGGFASMFVFFQSSLSNATQRYLNIELGKGDIRGATSVFRLHQTLYILIVAIVLLFGETVGLWFVCNKLVIPANRMEAAVWVYQFALLSYCLSIISVVYDAAIMAHEDMKIYSYIGISEGASKLVIAYVISVVHSDRLVIYAFLLFLLVLCMRIFYFFFCSRKYEECKSRFTWNVQEAKHTFSLIGWDAVGSFVYTLNDQGVNILLNMFFGPAVNAARGISYQISYALNNVCTNFYTAVRPQMMKSYASGDVRNLIRLFFRSSKYAVFLLWVLCLPVMLCIDPILSIWLTHVPEYTNIFTIWVLSYSMVNVISYPIGIIAFTVGHLKRYILIGNSIFFIALPFSYVCLKAGCSPVSVFQTLFIVRIAYIVAILLIIRRYVFFSIKQYIAEVIRPSITVIAISGSICLFLSKLLQQTFVGYSLLCCICVLSVLCLVWTFGITTKERNSIIKKVKAVITQIW